MILPVLTFLILDFVKFNTLVLWYVKKYTSQLRPFCVEGQLRF